jgi:hypothetical protein
VTPILVPHSAVGLALAWVGWAVLLPMWQVH